MNNNSFLYKYWMNKIWIEMNFIYSAVLWINKQKIQSGRRCLLTVSKNLHRISVAVFQHGSYTYFSRNKKIIIEYWRLCVASYLWCHFQVDFLNFPSHIFIFMTLGRELSKLVHKDYINAWKGYTTESTAWIIE